METLQAGRSDPWYMLDNAESCLDLLEKLPVVKTAPRPAPAPEAPPEPPKPTPKPVAKRPSVMEVDQDRSDPELVELFIEEAKEEVANIARQLPAWTADSRNSEALIAVRRSFHTLKGSGRMVGAQLIGAHRRLMRLFAEVGRRQQALAQYQQLRQTLRREYEADPDPGDAPPVPGHPRRALRSGCADRGAGGVAAPGRPTRARQDGRGPGHNLPVQLTSFVGRERELAELRAAARPQPAAHAHRPGRRRQDAARAEVAAERLRDYDDGVWLVELAAARRSRPGGAGDRRGAGHAAALAATMPARPWPG